MAALEVISLLEGTPQLMAPQTGDTYTLPRKAAITPEANTNALAVTGFSLTGANAQSMFDLAGTWNTTGTPTAFKLNITDTASNASSLLMDLQKGSVSVLSVTKIGTITQILGGVAGTGSSIAGSGATFSSSAFAPGATVGAAFIDSGHRGNIQVNSTGAVSWSSGSASSSNFGDTRLYRDAANTLALRNSTNAQEQRLWNTFTDASNGEYGYLSWKESANVFEIGTRSIGTGSKRTTRIAGFDKAGAYSPTIEFAFYPNAALASTKLTLIHSGGVLVTWGINGTQVGAFQASGFSVGAKAMGFSAGAYNGPDVSFNRVAAGVVGLKNGDADNAGGGIAFLDAGEKTIATGAITATGTFHTIDTEADAASDDLDTISGGTDGQLLIIQAENGARTVVAKDGTGNLQLAGDCTLDNAQDTLTLIYAGALTAWVEISRSDNGA